MRAKLFGCAVFLSCVLPALARESPAGNEWEDLSRLSEGKLPPHAWFGSFPDVSAARAIRPELSPRRLSLDSETEWRFHWSRRPSERPVGFYRLDFDVSSWDVVKVPCSWQAAGIRADGRRYGVPIFVNQPYIFTPQFPANSNCWPRVTGHALPEDWTFGGEDNPVGSYRRDFNVPADWMGDELVLQFDGVESFFYLWVNGIYVGFSKNSRSPAAFDVTQLVKAGRNTVAVEVYRNSDGSYLECQDIYRLSGIIRSVGLTHRPKTHLEDVRLTTAPVVRGAFDGDWRIALDVRKTGDAHVVTHLFSDDGSEVEAPGLIVRRPKLWSAEEPNLYTLVVALERNGRTIDAAGFQVGFREIVTEDATAERPTAFDLSAIKDVRIIRGDGNTAFRDPAVYFKDGTFHLFYTWAVAYPGSCTIGHSTSRDLVHWSAPKEILFRDCRFNFSSPGNMVKVGDEYVLCMQTYPTQFARPGEVVWADDTARIFTMKTRDFEHWSKPELIRVKGPDVPEKGMGRMIDAYLIRDHDGLWHCSYKQNGVSFSVSPDLKTWKYVGRIDGGENACIIEDDDGGWVMFHSPNNGIGVKRSRDLVHWTDDGLLTFGQRGWTWAQGRLTAGTVIDCRKVSGIGKYLMFFHATGPRTEAEGDNWRNGSLCIAWSDDLKNWSWPGK